MLLDRELILYSSCHQLKAWPWGGGGGELCWTGSFLLCSFPHYLLLQALPTGGGGGAHCWMGGLFLCQQTLSLTQSCWLKGTHCRADMQCWMAKWLQRVSSGYGILASIISDTSNWPHNEITIWLAVKITDMNGTMNPYLKWRLGKINWILECIIWPYDQHILLPLPMKWVEIFSLHT